MTWKVTPMADIVAVVVIALVALVLLIGVADADGG